jgi:hypothetical protein
MVMTNKGDNDLCGQGDPGNQDFEQEAERIGMSVRVECGVYVIGRTRQTAIGSLCLSDFANGSRPIVLG